MFSRKTILTTLAILALGGGIWYFSSSAHRASIRSAQTAKQPAVVSEPAAASATSTPQVAAVQFVPSANPPPPAKTKSVAAAPEPCPDTQHYSFDCYENYYRVLVRNQGVVAAFTDLKTRYTNNDYVRTQCHPLTHVLGQAATDKYPTVGEAFTRGDSFCWSGYYHGVMEGIVGKIGRTELPSQLNDICSSIPGKARFSFDYFNCVHGLGHGVMAYTNIELFDSLKLCDNLEGAWERSSCYGGVYMENVIVDNKNHFTKYLKPGDPIYPCNAVEEKYADYCYLMQTSYMLKVFSGDFVKVFAACASIPQNHQATCYQSLGRDASGRSTSNAQQTKATCELGLDYNQKSNCVIGAAKDFVSYFHSDQPAYQFCDALEQGLQQICRDTTKSYYAGL